MKVQVQTEDGTLEVEHTDLQLPENTELVSPDNANDKGYFTQAQLNAKAKEINKNKVSKAKEDLKSDEEFKKEVLSDYGISLDDNGKPVGLKPEFDPEEWKSTKAKELTKPLEDKLETEREAKQTYKQSLIEQSILSATKGQWEKQYTKFQDDGKVKPIVVNQYKGLFDIDDQGRVALKDGEGFAVNAKGQHITAEEYLSNEDKFSDYMVDKRQRSSRFSKGGDGGKKIWSRKEIKNLSTEEFEKNEDDIMAAMNEGRVTD